MTRPHGSLSGGMISFRTVGRRTLAGILVFLACFRAFGANYYVSLDPALPRVGDSISVTLFLPGVRAAGVKAPEPVDTVGLALQSISVSPASDMPLGADAAFGARIVYVFQAREAGDFRLPDLKLQIPEGPVDLRPIRVTILPRPGSPRSAPYLWKAPSTIMRWRCFPVELEAQTRGAPGIRGSSLPASFGLALESSGEGTFVGMALEEGTRILPAVRTPDGNPTVDARPIQVIPAPEGIAASRGIGKFSVRLEKPEKTRIRSGETLRLRVEVRGIGNLPVLEPPRFVVVRAFDQRMEAAPAFPVSEIRVVDGAYEGMAGRELRFVPERPGSYTIRTEPFAFLSTETGRIEIIRFAPIVILVEPPFAAPENNIASDPQLAQSLEGYASRPGVPGAAAAFALNGDTEAALRTLGARKDAKSLFLKGLVLMRGDRVPEALASLAAAERKSRFFPGLAETLALCERDLGGAVPVRDRLPEPRLFLSLAAVLALAGLALFVVLWMARSLIVRESAASVKIRTTAVILFASAAVLLMFGAVAALERRTAYAVVKVGEAYTVPSESGSSAAGNFRGMRGRVAAASDGWVLLRFPDERSAWFSAGDYIKY